MEERNVVMRTGGGSAGAVAVIALIVIAGLIAIFVWQPWNGSTTQRETSTTVQNGTSTSTQH